MTFCSHQRPKPRTVALGLVVLVALPSCSPASSSEPGTASRSEPAARVPAAPSETPKPEPQDVEPISLPSTQVTAEMTAAPPPAVPPLLDESGQALPQTETLPSTESAFFQKSARDLFDAIVADDPERAKPFFFPVVAYRQVKAIKDPDRDHERRLLALFERDVHTYHQKLGERPEQAAFVELRVPAEKSKWMAPGKEGNRLGYHRVLRSSLIYRSAEGKERSLEVTSLISWRGEWYVVHLHGFE